jgi:predicted RNA-binding Zn ribbon-like protein
VGGTREEPKERLHDYADLVPWAAHAGAIEAAEVEPLLAAAAGRPDEAGAVLARALELREAIYRIFVALAGDASPAEADLQRLNDELALALPHLRIVPAEHGYDYRFAADGGALDRPLWSIARSASELLAIGDLARVKQCTSDECAWLFVDLSKNKSRRWCDMRDCGNRAKARRYYRRQKGARG